MTSVDATRERILDAALDTLVSFGSRRTTIEGIAKRAGVSHMTVYRRWPTKNELLLAVVMREIQTLFTTVDSDIGVLDNPQDKIVAGFTGIYWFVHTHPLLGRALETDPESVLPILTTGAGPALDMATTYLAGHITSTLKDDIAPADTYGLAEILVRLTQSLLLTPRVRDALTTRQHVEDYARRHILPITQAATTSALARQRTR
ncbi:TetR/AcrR family transcriptional regulator [Mycobacterium sp. OAE908]|uniref:TetR/AcrR family transcriptional regulator n=1 Tax=Mycobacterium sp. OAE908 TaxID=2817899 RepID=UPI001AE4E9E3